MQTPWTAAIDGLGTLRQRSEYSRKRLASIWDACERPTGRRLAVFIADGADVVAGGEVLAVRLQDDDPDVVVLGRLPPGLVELVQKGQGLGIGRLGPVERDRRDPRRRLVVDEPGFQRCALRPEECISRGADVALFWGKCNSQEACVRLYSGRKIASTQVGPSPWLTRAIDCLVNVDLGDMKQPDWMVRVKEDYFKGGDSFFKSPELPELIDDMDANGVERAILMTRIDARADRAQRFVDGATRSLRARRRRLQPAAPDAVAARARVVRAQPPGRVRDRRTELLG